MPRATPSQVCVRTTVTDWFAGAVTNKVIA
jgi:hypothetical protein